MHHQRSKRALWKLKIGACHFLLNVVLAIGVIGCVGYGLVMDDQTILMVGGGGAAFWVFSTLAFFIKGSSLRCSLCMSPVWGGRKCQKHIKVKPTLGVSYRLGVALSIVFKGHYRCPYCGERFDARNIRDERPGNKSRANKGERRIRTVR